MGSLRRDNVFTTTQVAELCGFSVRKACECVDDGRLKGYRIPGRRDRRIPRESLVAFMQANHIPLGALTPAPAVLLVGVPCPGIIPPAEDVAKFLPGWVVVACRGVFEAGMAAATYHPKACAVDLSLGRAECLSVIRGLNGCRKVALVYDDEAGQDGLAGVSTCLNVPTDAMRLAKALSE